MNRGQTKTVKFPLTDEDFAYCSEEEEDWHIKESAFEI
ncbi:fibronectin type III-like domain-contianing protein [bacterium]|nr:fibronectin type III-like domain-contianing protein [bacterium]